MSRGLAVRPDRLVVVVAMALAGLALVFATDAGATVKADELHITYVGTTSLQLKLADGTTVRSGATLPAGSYLVVVVDENDTNPDFRISGPGVNLSSGLNTAMGMGDAFPLGAFTFQAGSTYQISDGNMPSSAAISVSFGAGSGSSTAGSGSTGSTGSSGSASGSTGSSSSSSTASSATNSAGALKATVSVSGAGKLTLGGKAPKTLRAGRYTITVDDRSKAFGLVLGHASAHPTTLSSSSAVGTGAHTVTLGAGKWFYATSAHGQKTYFTVVA